MALPIGLPVPQGATERGLSRYVECIEGAGGEVRVIRPADAPEPENLVSSLGGLYLIGGADIHPRYYGEEPDPDAGLVIDEERDALEFALLRAALEADLPVFAICRGMQVLNVAFGGKLLQDIPNHQAIERESAYHPIFVIRDSRLAELLSFSGIIEVNSRHHQGVRAEIKAPGLVATATRPDDGIIEALESPEHRFVLGVQCHPERADEVPREFEQLFATFVEAARGE